MPVEIIGIIATYVIILWAIVQWATRGRGQRPNKRRNGSKGRETPPLHKRG